MLKRIIFTALLVSTVALADEPLKHTAPDHPACHTKDYVKSVNPPDTKFVEMTSEQVKAFVSKYVNGTTLPPTTIWVATLPDPKDTVMHIQGFDANGCLAGSGSMLPEELQAFFNEAATI